MVKVEVQGLNELLNKFNDLSAKAKDGVQKSLNEWANRTSAEAKSVVSANSSDLGMLQNSISAQYGNFEASVVTSAAYAAYIEFGTKKFAANYVSSLPSNWQEYANRYKGTGTGRNENFFDVILAWVKRKGIVGPIFRGGSGKNRNRQKEKIEQEAAAYLIAKSILINGIKPHPFLYPSAEKFIPLLLEDIKNSIKL